MDSVQERVKKGAEVMDRERPGWWRRTNLDRFDIDSNTRCILGQEFGGYTNAMGKVTSWVTRYTPGGIRRWMQDRGFMASYEAGDAFLLEAEWRALITQRRVADRPRGVDPDERPETDHYTDRLSV